MNEDGNNLFDKNGHPIEAVWVLTDVSIEYADSLHAERERFRRLILETFAVPASFFDRAILTEETPCETS